MTARERVSSPETEYDVVQAVGENDSDSDTATATVAPVASAPSFDTVTVTTALESAGLVIGSACTPATSTDVPPRAGTSFSQSDTDATCRELYGLRKIA